MPNICEQYTAERGLYREPLTFHGHLAVNGAQTDVLKFTPEESGCITGNLGLYAVNFYGHLKEMTLAQHGKANTLASLVLEPSPHSGFSVCVYDFNAYAGKFRVPGQAYIEGKVRGRLDEAKTYKGVGKCRKKVAGPFTIGVYGRNGKPLETELVAATGR
jgi:hypothetical protein